MKAGPYDYFNELQKRLNRLRGVLTNKDEKKKIDDLLKAINVLSNNKNQVNISKLDKSLESISNDSSFSSKFRESIKNVRQATPPTLTTYNRSLDASSASYANQGSPVLAPTAQSFLQDMGLPQSHASAGSPPKPVKPQKNTFWNRHKGKIIGGAIFAVCAIVGIAIIAATLGAATPFVVMGGAAVGIGLIGIVGGGAVYVGVDRDVKLLEDKDRMNKIEDKLHNVTTGENPDLTNRDSNSNSLNNTVQPPPVSPIQHQSLSDQAMRLSSSTTSTVLPPDPNVQISKNQSLPPDPNRLISGNEVVNKPNLPPPPSSRFSATSNISSVNTSSLIAQVNHEAQKPPLTYSYTKGNFPGLPMTPPQELQELLSKLQEMGSKASPEEKTKIDKVMHEIESVQNSKATPNEKLNKVKELVKAQGIELEQPKKKESQRLG